MTHEHAQHEFRVPWVYCWMHGVRVLCLNDLL